MLDMGFSPRSTDRRRSPEERQTCSSRRRSKARPAARWRRRTPRRPPPRAPPALERGRRAPLLTSTTTPSSAPCPGAPGGERGRTLVFVRTKRGADRLVKRLRQTDLPAVAMHGNKFSRSAKALARFESGHVDTLVATDVAARGIDVTDITHVINFDAPEDRDAYTHRVGRTGRAGSTGTESASSARPDR